MERAMGFEPTTSTLARLRSTPELRPRLQEGSGIYGKRWRLQDPMHCRAVIAAPVYGRV